MNIHMSSKNTKTKTAPKVEAKKQTAGTPEKVVAVPTANTIVEKKMEDKVVAVEKKAAPKKGGAKTEAAPKVEAAPAKVEAKTEKKAETKKGGAKTEAVPAKVEAKVEAAPAPAKVEAKTEKKAATKKGGAKTETPKVEAAPAKVEAKTEKKAAAKKGGAKTEAPKAEAAKVEAKTEKKAEKKEAKKGGAKKEAKKEVKKEEVKAAAQDDDEEGEVAGTKLRYFKLIYNEEVQGRYCGKKPKQAANKAFSSIIKDLKKTGEQNGGVNVDINFSIRECTRNSKHKEYKYIGKRQVLTNPVQVKIANADGSVKQIEYKFHNKLQKAPKA